MRVLLYAAAVVCLLAGSVWSVFVISNTPECPEGYEVRHDDLGLPGSGWDFCERPGASMADAWDDAAPAVRYDVHMPRRIAVFGAGLALAVILLAVALRVRDYHGLLFRDYVSYEIWVFWVFVAMALGVVMMLWGSCVRVSTDVPEVP